MGVRTEHNLYSFINLSQRNGGGAVDLLLLLGCSKYRPATTVTTVKRHFPLFPPSRKKDSLNANHDDWDSSHS